ncbi:MAG TPA: transcription antitermination factor NusB [Myxococcota bacterium]|nr:transcription antitermination factor NusB [Myxococcota bacterium]
MKTAKASASRHRSREAALQMLYAIDLGRRGPAGDAGGVEEVFQSVCENFELPEGARAFAKELLTGVTAKCPALDAEIASHAQRWRISRMAAVDRNVLRLGAFELLHSDAPAAVVIDEAVELARRFGGERSPGFVNGILDAIARGRHGAEEAS